MPFRKSAEGKWIQTIGRRLSSVSISATKLLIIDKQIDGKGALLKSINSDVMTVSFDSKSHSLQDVVEMVRTAHRSNGKPFQSMALANHGPDAKGEWHFSKGLKVDLQEKGVRGKDLAKNAAYALAPFFEVCIAALEKTKMNQSFICLLGCMLAGFNKDFVPFLEDLYHVDFRASTDNTGNEGQHGADWKMETDGDYDFGRDYLDEELVKKYTEVFNPVLIAGLNCAAAGFTCVGSLFG